MKACDCELAVNML